MSVASSFQANDGTRLSVRIWNPPGEQPCIVLVHGWSGSSRSFDRQLALGESGRCKLVCYDQRFHGSSDKPEHGFHVARLAMDLREMLVAHDSTSVTLVHTIVTLGAARGSCDATISDSCNVSTMVVVRPQVGTSMGASVIWSYFELFGSDRVARAVFVDQAPLQNKTSDWVTGSKGCYDSASLANLQRALAEDMNAFADGNLECCASLPLGADLEEVLKAETVQCNPRHLGLLMADHTQLDWRPVLPRITVPCLNCIGVNSGVFPVEGCEAVSRLIPNCKTAYFERANHWLYMEEPNKFNELLMDFVHDKLTEQEYRL